MGGLAIQTFHPQTTDREVFNLETQPTNPTKNGIQNFHPMSLLQPFVGTISNSLFEEMTCNVKPSIQLVVGGHTEDTQKPKLLTCVCNLQQKLEQTFELKNGVRLFVPFCLTFDK